MTSDEMYAEAERLAKQQREERGWVPGATVVIEGKQVKTLIPGPYESTPANEQRARRIVRLRKSAAKAAQREQVADLS